MIEMRIMEKAGRNGESGGEKPLFVFKGQGAAAREVLASGAWPGGWGGGCVPGGALSMESQRQEEA